MPCAADQNRALAQNALAGRDASRNTPEHSLRPTSLTWPGITGLPSAPLVASEAAGISPEGVP
jgi:hypothetical protein